MNIDSSLMENLWKIYYYVALFATILFVLKLLIFSITGSDSEVAADFTTETDTDCSFNFLSLQAIIAFFMGFGWMGYAGLQQLAMNKIESFIYAIVVGLIFFFATAFLMFGVKKLEKTVKKDKSSAIGKLGKAYTKFEPNGKGQIEIEINGQLSIADAINQSSEEINSFEIIKVVEFKNDLLYIEKVKQTEN